MVQSINYLNTLPYIGLGVDHTHVRLVGTTIHHNAVIHLQECILRVILRAASKGVSVMELETYLQENVDL